MKRYLLIFSLLSILGVGPLESAYAANSGNLGTCLYFDDLAARVSGDVLTLQSNVRQNSNTCSLYTPSDNTYQPIYSIPALGITCTGPALMTYSTQWAMPLGTLMCEGTVTKFGTTVDYLVVRNDGRSASWAFSHDLIVDPNAAAKAAAIAAANAAAKASADAAIAAANAATAAANAAAAAANAAAAKASADAAAAASNAAAELKAKQEAEAKAAAELKAKQEAEAKAAAELKAKQEAEAKAAAELKAKQEAEAKAATDKILAATKTAVAKAAAAKAAAAKAAAAKAAAAKAAAAKAAAAKAAAAKKTTITCVKGKLTKKVTAVKPVCPAGYKKK
jgi:hypothetical protein